MSWEQSILNASVSVNRCVWAINEAMQKDKSHYPGEDYIKQEAREAIKELLSAIDKMENNLIFTNSHTL